MLSMVSSSVVPSALRRVRRQLLPASFGWFISQAAS